MWNLLIFDAVVKYWVATDVNVGDVHKIHGNICLIKPSLAALFKKLFEFY